MMDFATGKTWIELNQLIDEYFDPLDMQGIEENKFCWLNDLLTSGNVVFSGSIPENTFVQPEIRNGFEGDILKSEAHIPYDILKRSLEDVHDEPGYCRLRLSEPIAGLLDGTQLEVKEIKRGHQSTLYIAPNPIFFDDDGELIPSDYSSSLLPNNRPARIVVQSLFDTLHLSEIVESLQRTRTGPVMNWEVGVPSNEKDLIPQHPKKMLYKFLENLSVRILGNLNGTTNDGNEQIQSDKNQQISTESIDHKQQNSKIDLSFKLSMDICPAIQCSGWPIKAEAFFHRTRKWPDEALLQQIKKEGFHLVYKPLEPHSSKSVEWRFSFSKAEYILLKNMDAFKIQCYRILKTIYYSELTMPNILCSYHLKNIFLWACERIPPQFWVDLNLSQIIMGLLDDLLDCLATKTCRHFFIPENNLFSHVHGDFLDRMVALVSKIRRHPERLLLLIKETVKSHHWLPGTNDDNNARKTASDFDIELD